MSQESSTPESPARYELPAVTVDIVVFCLCNDDLQVLLIQRKAEPYKRSWALPGGFVDIDESLDHAARRELQEETGVSDVYLEQLFTFGEPDRDPRMRVISVAYVALVSAEAVTLQAGDDAMDARWFSLSDLPSLAFDHAEIVDYALTRLRYKLEYSHVGFKLLPEEFTLSELQTAYETVLGERLDKRNFRRKILQAKILRETGEHRFGEGRPAKLYRYREDAEQEIKARRLFP